MQHGVGQHCVFHLEFTPLEQVSLFPLVGEICNYHFINTARHWKAIFESSMMQY